MMYDVGMEEMGWGRVGCFRDVEEGSGVLEIGNWDYEM